jgi:phosphoribosylpyrophosphate synthetase
VNQLAGADVVIVDDMIDTAGTLSELSVQLVHAGVNRIYLCASHGLFTSKSMDIIDNVESLTKVIVTNSLPLSFVCMIILPFICLRVNRIIVYLFDLLPNFDLSWCTIT